MSTSEPNGTQVAESPPSKLARWWPLIALVIVVAALIVGECAFQRAKPQGWTTYTTADGLADNYLEAIAVAPDGVLWIGTWEDGVSRFDGQNWTTFTTRDGMADNHVYAMAVAPNGILWVSHVSIDGDMGVSRFDGETWTNYTEDNGLAANDVRAIAVAPDGALWFGTMYSGVSRFDGETWTTYTVDDGLRSNSVPAIAVAPDGALWFVTDYDGVSRFDGKTWTDFTKRDGLPGLSIAVAPDGTVWVGAGTRFGNLGGVSAFCGETWTSYTEVDGLGDNDVQAIAVAPDGTLWFGTERGISRFDPLAKDGAWTTYTAADGLAGNDALSVATAADGRVWVSSELLYGNRDGVSYFDGKTWTTYTVDNSGLGEDLVSVLTVDQDGRVWMGTDGGGLVVFDERVVAPMQDLQAWAVLRPIAIAASVLLVLVWIMRRFHALPAPRRAQTARSVGIAAGVAAAVALPCISIWGVVGAGHGGFLEGTGLELVGCAGPILGPILGTIMVVYLVRRGRGKKTEEQAALGWNLWVLWVVAGVVGWAVGWVAAILVTYFVAGDLMGVTVTRRLIPVPVGALAGATVGGLLGVAHGFILRRRALLETDWWVLASAASGAVGWVLVRVADLGISTATFAGGQFGVQAGAIAGAIFGALLGAAQWLVLRRQVSRAGWWILASAVAWSVGGAVGWAVGGVASFVVPGVLGGAITGAALVWLLRAANRRGEHAPGQGNG